MGEMYQYPHHKGGGGYNSMHCNLSMLYMGFSDDERKCLLDRKYWCFLLSRLAVSGVEINQDIFSIVTFCVSMLLVVVWRIIAHLCCQPPEREPAQKSTSAHQYKAINGGFLCLFSLCYR